MHVRSPEELTELFRANGRKVTAQRQCIFGVLQGDVTHPSAETVHERASRTIGTISLKTVYQTLNDLSELGEITSLDLGTGTTRFDPNVDDHHHHLVCRRCGTVRDLVAAFPDPTIPEGAECGFEVGSAEIVFRGLCPSCQAAPGWQVPGGRRRPMPTDDRIDATVMTDTTDERNGTPCQH